MYSKLNYCSYCRKSKLKYDIIVDGINICRNCGLQGNRTLDERSTRNDSFKNEDIAIPKNIDQSFILQSSSIEITNIFSKKAHYYQQWIDKPMKDGTLPWEKINSLDCLPKSNKRKNNCFSDEEETPKKCKKARKTNKTKKDSTLKQLRKLLKRSLSETSCKKNICKLKKIKKN